MLRQISLVFVSRLAHPLVRRQVARHQKHRGVPVPELPGGTNHEAQGRVSGTARWHRPECTSSTGHVLAGIKLRQHAAGLHSTLTTVLPGVPPSTTPGCVAGGGAHLERNADGLVGQDVLPVTLCLARLHVRGSPGSCA